MYNEYMTYVNNKTEVNCMPRRDGTGPMGRGALTGRGLGSCIGAGAVRFGAGLGAGLGMGFACRRGFGWGFGRGLALDETSPEGKKGLLEEQKHVLKERLEAIERQIENL
jgi:hypothetical protein